MTQQGSILGNRVLRKEDRGLLVGERRYFADMATPDTAHVVFVRSTIAHADISELDISEALSMPGVLAVHTSATLDIAPEPTMPFLDQVMARPHLCVDKVRFVGDIVAVVVAETVAQAVDATEMVIVDYEPLPVVADVESGMAEDAPLIWESLVFETSSNYDADVLAGAKTVVRERLVSQRLAAAPIEPIGCLAEVDGEHLTMWIPSQNPITVADQIAASVGVDRDNLRVAAPAVGGGFGAKGGYYTEFGLVGKIALLLDRAVMWTSTRSEDMLALTQGRGQIIDVELGIDEDGGLVGLRGECLADAGAYGGLGAFLTSLTQLMMHGPYNIGAVAFRGRAVATNTTRISAYRGAGRPEAAQAIERVMDAGARAMNIDPAEFRRRNYIQPSAFPLTTSTGASYDCGNYEAALDAVLEASGYEQLRADQRERRANGSARQLGIGVSSYVEITAPPGLSGEWGRVEVNNDGTATMTVGTSSHGQGHDTSFSMIVSDVLGIAMDDVVLQQSDTDVVPRGGGTVGSRSLQTGGSVLLEASKVVLAKAKDLAAHLLEADPSDIVVADGALQVAGVPASSLSWAELASAAADESARPHDMEPGLAHELVFETKGSTFPFGSHVAVVEVDIETGGVELLRHIAVDDAGRILNPMLVRGQQHGGIAQGVSQALFEWVRYDEDANPISPTFMDYLIPSATEFPSFEATNTETPTPNNPLGAKGIGESGTIGSTPAVHSAVIDAMSHLGVTHLDMPLSPERLWRAIETSRTPEV